MLRAQYEEDQFFDFFAKRGIPKEKISRNLDALIQIQKLRLAVGADGLAMYIWLVAKNDLEAHGIYEHLGRCIESLGLRPTTERLLKNKGVRTLFDLVQLTEADLGPSRITGFGPLRLLEVKDKLRVQFLCLGMQFSPDVRAAIIQRMQTHGSK